MKWILVYLFEKVHSKMVPSCKFPSYYQVKSLWSYITNWPKYNFFILKCVPKIPLYSFATHHILFFPFSHCGKETSRFRTLKKVQKRVNIWKAQYYLTYFESTCSESTAWCLLQLGHLLKLSGNLNLIKFMKTRVLKFIILKKNPLQVWTG